MVQVLTTLPSDCYSALLVPEAPGAGADTADDTAALDTVLHLLNAKLQQVRTELTPYHPAHNASAGAVRASQTIACDGNIM